ncbi:MAG: hypothetical protein R3E90_10935 [Marinicella sp.]|nr:hypothetical protein [Xanthomonadales bacterium]
MNKLILLMGTVLLSACVSRTINLRASTTEYDGVVAQSVRFTHKSETYQWVCYSELKMQKLVGISCQNDTALQLFSGGLVGDSFVFEYPSRFLMKIQPKNMLAYIKMSLFEVLEYDTSAMQVRKSSVETTINDIKRKVKLSIKTL